MPRKPKARAPLSEREPFVIAGTTVAPGERRTLQLAAARLPTQTQLSIPLVVVHGLQDGPRLWLSAAIHGDELNGVEIIRRVLETISPLTLRGTLVAVPIVNVFGFLEQSRYLPIGSQGDRGSTWQIPLCARHGSANNWSESCQLIRSKTQRVELDAGCDDYVAKPINRPLLLRTVAKYAAGSCATP